MDTPYTLVPKFPAPCHVTGYTDTMTGQKFRVVLVNGVIVDEQQIPTSTDNS